MSKKVAMGFAFFIFGVLVFAQDVTTNHYRFANTYDMGISPFEDTYGRERIWTLYNINRQPTIDVETFFDTLLKEQDSSGRYRNNEDINLHVYFLNPINHDDRVLSEFMDANGQNVAIMSIIYSQTEDFTMVYKLEGIWHILFFTRKRLL